MHSRSALAEKARPFMPPSTARIVEILLKAKVVDELQARSALAKQGQWGGRLCKHIADLHFAEETAIADALAQAFSLPRANLEAQARDATALAKVDAAFAEEHAVFPFAIRERTLWIAMADPADLDTVDAIAARSGCRVRAAVATESEIREAIRRSYPQSQAAQQAQRATRPISLHDAPVPVAADGLPEAPAPLAERLGQVQAELEKTKTVLRALLELCIAHKVLTREEIGAAVARVQRT